MVSIGKNIYSSYELRQRTCDRIDETDIADGVLERSKTDYVSVRRMSGEYALHVEINAITKGLQS
jgi:hypothetical protein